MEIFVYGLVLLFFLGLIPLLFLVARDPHTPETDYSSPSATAAVQQGSATITYSIFGVLLALLFILAVLTRRKS